MHRKTNRGFIRLILLVIVAVLILSYFGVSIRSIAGLEAGQDNFGFIKEVGVKIWDFSLDLWTNYLRQPVLSVWAFAWDSFAKFKDSLPLTK